MKKLLSLTVISLITFTGCAMQEQNYKKDEVSSYNSEEREVEAPPVTETPEPTPSPDPEEELEKNYLSGAELRKYVEKLSKIDKASYKRESELNSTMQLARTKAVNSRSNDPGLNQAYMNAASAYCQYATSEAKKLLVLKPAKPLPYYVEPALNRMKEYEEKKVTLLKKCLNASTVKERDKAVNAYFAFKAEKNADSTLRYDVILAGL